MAKWSEYLDESDSGKNHFKKKVNKHYYCKKNKIRYPPTRGIFFGTHVYENGSKTCKLCGHINKGKTDDRTIEDENNSN